MPSFTISNALKVFSEQRHLQLYATSFKHAVRKLARVRIKSPSGTETMFWFPSHDRLHWTRQTKKLAVVRVVGGASAGAMFIYTSLFTKQVADADIIFLPCGFFFLFLPFSSPNLTAADWMSAILPHMVWP